MSVNDREEVQIKYKKSKDKNKRKQEKGTEVNASVKGKTVTHSGGAKGGYAAYDHEESESSDEKQAKNA